MDAFRIHAITKNQTSIYITNATVNDLQCRKWYNFMSHNDRLTDNLSYKCVSINYDENLAQEIETEIIQFLQKIDKRIKQIKKLPESENVK